MDPSGLESSFDEDVDDIAAAYYADRTATQIEVIERSKALMRGVGAYLAGMAEQMAIETAAASIWAPAPYAFALYDTAQAFRYMAEEGFSWGGAFGIAANLYGARASASIGSGFGIRARRGQSAAAGLGVDIEQGAYRFHLAKNEGNYRRPKPVNLPAWRSIHIDIDHIMSGHTIGGMRQGSAKSLFPSYMTSSQVERTVREAYRYGQRVGGIGDRIVVVGQAQGLNIKIIVNISTKSIVTAYPM